MSQHPTPFKKNWRVNVNSLSGLAPNERRKFERESVMDELLTSGASVPDTAPITFTGSVDWVEGNRLVLTGNVHAPWTGECRRCVGVAEGSIDIEVREIFEPKPTEGETYPLTGEVIDIEPMIREVIMLELPVAVTCKEDCAGLCPNCGVNRNEVTCECVTEQVDIRWAGLDQFKTDN